MGEDLLEFLRRQSKEGRKKREEVDYEEMNRLKCIFVFRKRESHVFFLP